MGGRGSSFKNTRAAMKTSKNKSSGSYKWIGGKNTQNLIDWVQSQVHIDLSSYIDTSKKLYEGNRKYVNVNTKKMSINDRNKLINLSSAYGGGYFSLMDNGGLGTAFVFGEKLKNMKNKKKGK